MLHHKLDEPVEVFSGTGVDHLSAADDGQPVHHDGQAPAQCGQQQQ